MRTNYHTHTSRCHHASGTDREYVEAAIASGYSTLGFSDHCPWPFEDWFNIPVRMAWNELDGYTESIAALKDAYKDKLNILCGLECEFFPQHVDILRELRSRADYLILGQHYDTTAPKEVYVGGQKDLVPTRHYIDLVIQAMRTGLFACVAHPDLFLTPYEEFTPDLRQLSHELCRAAKSLGVPLEFNLYGVRKLVDQPSYTNKAGLGYPYPGFWRIAAEEGCTAIVGVDAHKPDALRDPELVVLAGMYLDSLGIKRTESLLWDKQ